MSRVRRWSRLLTLAVLVAPLASAGHQSGDVVVEDPIGDQYALYPVFGEHGDIERFFVGHETEESITLGVDLVTFERQDGDRSGMFVRFYFNYDEFNYALLAYPFGSLPDGYGGCPAAFGQGMPETFTCVDVEIDEAEALMEFTIPRDLIKDRRSVPPYAGSQLEYVSVRVSDSIVPGVLSTGDSAPADEGSTYEFQLGERGGGDLLLWAPVPIRASNGEAATYVYEMMAENEGPVDRTVVVSTSTAEPSFSARAPALLHLPANSTTRFPLVLSMDFQHDHGRTGTVEVVMEDADDEAHWGRAVVGVQWLEVPQPAGHHNELFLHSTEGEFVPYLISGFNLWTNTLETDETRTATDVPAAPETVTAEGLSTRYTWRFALRPQLVMGLLVDNDAVGRFEMPFLASNDLAQAQARLELIAGPGANRTLLASGQAASTPLSSSQATMLEGEMVPEHVGVIPFEPGMVFALYVHLTVDQPDPKASYLYPRLVVDDARYSLPLAEYSDPVDTKFVSSLRAEVEPSRLRQNPGGVAVFPITLSNDADRQLTVDLAAASRRAELFDLPASIKIPAGGNQTVQVAVHVPDTAVPGQTIVGAIIAEAPSALGAYAAVRLTVDIVDPSIEVIPPDDLQRATDKGSPFPAATALLIMLLVQLAVRGRRR